MDSALAVSRLQFAFTITYHYLFPQLTMGLALLIFLLKSRALRSGDQEYDRAARFWTRIFAINFAMGVVTGIPMEFQFGTNWAAFSRAAGGVIGQTLAMEGVFSFFLESTFLGFLLYGEKRLGPRGHWAASLLVFLGSWLSGYFIVATNAWMQHPVGYTLGSGGEVRIASLLAVLFNPWAVWQYLHTMLGAVLTGCFVMASVGAFYLLSGRHEAGGRLFLRQAIAIGAVAAFLQIVPTGDRQGKLVAHHQPVTLAAMEGLFTSEHGAPIVLIGQPDMERMRLDNPIAVPRVLSFLTYNRWGAEVKGLDSFPREDWPQNVPLLYYSYHIMVGLGTIFLAVLAIAAWLLRGGRLFRSRGMLWALMLMLPFPYIANTAGWFTAELGRQPWLVYGLLRTADGASPTVAAGNVLFSLIGFMGMYTVLSILFLFLVHREIDRGPEPAGAGTDGER
ncbi:MAG TPA: cytochrome ubiquinol oxidase subunit I [Candidatus Polarisedimenticolia bacterium]|nr:cytochrome ubiquinol oxidase subunit I [Candidatus Polarisedimenticolia bacterium]